MKKLILSLYTIAFLGTTASAAEDLHAAVVEKVSAEHAHEMKNGDFSRRKSVSSSSHAVRTTASTKPKPEIKKPVYRKKIEHHRPAHH